MKEKLAALYAVQQLDSTLDALKREYAAQDRGQTEQGRYETAKAAHVEAEAALHRAQAEHKDTELEQKTVEDKRKAVETKLYSGKVTAPKELQAMSDEVEMLGRQRERLDEKLLTLLGELEAARVQEAETKQALAAATSAFRAKLNAYKETSEMMQAQARELAAQRNNAAKDVDAALLKRYETLRASKNGLAIVPLVEGNACGGCKMGLPSSIIADVRAGKSVVLCDNCQRMLIDIG